MNQKDIESIIKLQTDLSTRIINESRIDNKIKLLNITNQLRKKTLLKEQLILIAGEEGMLEDQILEAIDDLLQDRMLEEKDGYIKIN